MSTMSDVFWQEYPENEPEPAHLNGPCMMHGRFDCFDCCPELYDEDTMGGYEYIDVE